MGMFLLIITCLLFLIAIFLFAVPVLDTGGSTYERVPVLVPIIVVLLALSVGFCSTITTVSAKHEGVVIAFGKISDRTLDPGLSLKMPWEKVVSIDTTRQVDNYNDGSQDTDHSVIKVLLGNGNETVAYASISWSINEEQANTIYTDFRDDDPTELVYQRAVAPDFKQAVVSAVQTYNPTAELAKVDPENITSVSDVNLTPDLTALSALARANFEKLTPSVDDQPLIKVLDVQISFIPFDDDTKTAISNFQAEVLRTITAKQSIQTAIQQATANEKLEESLSNNPNVLVSRCLDLIAAGKLQLPAGGSCWPSGGSAVVIPAGGPEK